MGRPLRPCWRGRGRSSVRAASGESMITYSYVLSLDAVVRLLGDSEEPDRRQARREAFERLLAEVPRLRAGAAAPRVIQLAVFEGRGVQGRPVGAWDWSAGLRQPVWTGEPRSWTASGDGEPRHLAGDAVDKDLGAAARAAGVRGEPLRSFLGGDLVDEASPPGAPGQASPDPRDARAAEQVHLHLP